MDQVLVYPDPLGVVLIMGAWNYPIQLPLLPLAAAIAAGNVAIVKPSEIAVNCANIIMEMMPKYLDNVSIEAKLLNILFLDREAKVEKL